MEKIMKKQKIQQADIWQPKILKAEDGYYGVESQAVGGCFYRVSEDLTTCQCPHFMRRLIDTGKKCKHMKQLEAYFNENGIEIKKPEETSSQIPF